MKLLNSTADADQALAQPLMIIFKHSTRCPISSAAYGEMLKFMADHSGIPVRMIDVIADRELSRYVAEKTGIKHESPQALLIKGGQLAWNASHGDITKAALEEHALP